MTMYEQAPTGVYITQKGAEAADQVKEMGYRWSREVLGLNNDLLDYLTTISEAGKLKDLLEWEPSEVAKLQELAGIGYVEFAYPTEPVPARFRKVRDTRTGITYDSRSQAGRAVASDYGFYPEDHFVWYRIIKEDPSRFELVD